MRSPEAGGRRRALVGLAVRELGHSRAYWTTLFVTSLLSGFSFRQALALYGETSRAAAAAPGLAAALRPLDGVLVPTFGSLYFATTLLLPFAAVRLLGGEKQSGSLKLTLQLAVSRTELLGVKLAALGLGWALLLLPAVSAVALWRGLGGHVDPQELAGLLLGHSLYAFVVVAWALLASALADSPSTGAILVLAATLGSWVLDFASHGGGDVVGLLAAASLTRLLRPLEAGLLAASHLAGWLIAGLTLLAVSATWLHPGVALLPKLRRSAIALAVAGLSLAATSRLGASWDLTEDRRHSFAPAVASALSQLEGRLEVTVFLRPEDPRTLELERAILSRLRRAVRRLETRVGDVDSASAFGSGGADRYGTVVYAYDGRLATSRSTSPREVLPLLWQLTRTPPPQDDDVPYPGYPLVAEDSLSGPWFYGLLPALILAAAAAAYRAPTRRRW